MSTDIGSEIEAAYEVGLANVEHTVNGHTVLALREGYAPHIIDTTDLEERRPWPQGYATLADEGSFIAYIRRFWRTGESVVFSDVHGNLRAIFDFHLSEAETDEAIGRVGATSPSSWQGGRREFGANFEPRFTESWNSWRAANARELDQASLLTFLEARMGDVVEPAGADLFEVLQFFRVHADVGFSSAKNLTNGAVQFQWTEEVQASGGGSLVVPTEFTVRLKPYRDLPDTKDFKAKLRYRLAKPSVKFHFEFFNEELDEFLESLMEQRRLRVSAGLGAEPVVFFGSPS